MSDRSKTISKLISDGAFRASYLKAKLDVLIPSQIRALRRKQELKQSDLASLAMMKQSRISAIESPGATNFNLETLVRLASAFKVGLRVEFVPFSEVLEWENEFSQDEFFVTTIDKDMDFIQPQAESDMFVTYQIPAGLSAGQLNGDVEFDGTTSQIRIGDDIYTAVADYVEISVFPQTASADSAHKFQKQEAA